MFVRPLQTLLEIIPTRETVETFYPERQVRDRMKCSEARLMNDGISVIIRNNLQLIYSCTRVDKHFSIYTRYL